MWPANHPEVDITDRAIETAKDYGENILDYKRVPSYNVLRKIKMKKRVRSSKRKLRKTNEELRSHYSVRTSFPEADYDPSTLSCTELIVQSWLRCIINCSTIRLTPRFWTGE